MQLTWSEARRKRPSRLALVGAGSLIGSFVALEISWNTSESELTTTSVLATVAWLVLGCGAVALLVGAAT